MNMSTVRRLYFYLELLILYIINLLISDDVIMDGFYTTYSWNMDINISMFLYMDTITMILTTNFYSRGGIFTSFDGSPIKKEVYT